MKGFEDTTLSQKKWKIPSLNTKCIWD
jgi:hypothetical protein